MSAGYYQPLKPGRWSKYGHRALLQISLHSKNYDAFIFAYICLHAHPKTNQVKFKGSLNKTIHQLTGWDPRTIKKALANLRKLKVIKTLTPTKPHFLVNSEAMNSQTYLPEGFQQGLQMPKDKTIDAIMSGLPVFEKVETDKRNYEDEILKDFNRQDIKVNSMLDVSKMIKRADRVLAEQARMTKQLETLNKRLEDKMTFEEKKELYKDLDVIDLDVFR